MTTEVPPITESSLTTRLNDYTLSLLKPTFTLTDYGSLTEAFASSLRGQGEQSTLLPNSNSLPLVIKKMYDEYILTGGLLSREKYLSKLHVVALDVKDIRLVNTKAGETTGDLVILSNAAGFLNMNSLGYTTGILRVSGDEMLGFIGPTGQNTEIDPRSNLDLQNEQIIENIHTLFPKTTKIFCNLSIKNISPLSQVRIPSPKNQRSYDLTNALYHFDPLNSHGKNAVKLLETNIKVTLDNQPNHQQQNWYSVRKILPFYLNSYMRERNNAQLSNIIELAAFNQSYPRAEVYNPRPFLHKLVETIRDRPDENIELLMVAPIWLKNKNNQSHHAGDELLRSTLKDLRQKYGHKIVGITQTGGSFLVAIENNDRSDLAKEITESHKITSDRFIVASNVSQTQSEAYQTFRSNASNAPDPNKLASLFWNDIVDPHRPSHYFTELKVVVDGIMSGKYQSDTLWDFLHVRLSTRLDTLQVQLGSIAAASNLPLPVQFLNFLTNLPIYKEKIFNSHNFAEFYRAISGIKSDIQHLAGLAPPPPRSPSS